LRFAAEFGLTAENFETALHVLEAKKFATEGVYDKSVKSPDRRRAASIYWASDQTLAAFVRISEGGRETDVLFARLGVGLNALEAFVWKPKWISAKQVNVLHTNQEDHWVVPLNGGPIRYISKRAEAGHAHMQCVLGAMYLKGHLVLPDREEGIRWLRLSLKNGHERARGVLREAGILE